MLTAKQLDVFEQNGFLVVENVLDDDDLTPLEREYATLLNEKCKTLFKQNRISSTFAEFEFGERFSKTLAEYPGCVDEFNISLPLVNGEVDADNYHAHTGPAVFWLLRNEKILDLVESVIGPEIASSPVQQMRIKPPQRSLGENNVAHSNVGITTWHQDTVAVMPEADETIQLTVWIAVTDATEQNGCLVSIPGSHCEGAHRHEPGRIAREPSVPESVINGRTGVPLPVKRGGVIMFHKQNIHSSMPNRSGHLRWSVDVRYHPVGQPSGRPAFPGFVARSHANPGSELRDPVAWQQLWDDARSRIVHGKYKGPVFRDWERFQDNGS